MLHIKCTYTHTQIPCQKIIFYTNILIIRKLKKFTMNRINKKLVLLTLMFLGCSENDILPCNLDTQNNLTYSNGKLFNGTCHVMVENDVILKTLTYKRGKLSKEIAYYKDSGGLEYIGYRDKEGHITGKFVKYYRNGQLELEGKLKKGYRTGIWQIYNEKGELIEEVKYDDRGKPVNNN